MEPPEKDPNKDQNDADTTDDSDNGGDGGGEFEMPEKFKDKSAEEIAKSYTELEKQLGDPTKSSEEISEIKGQLKTITEHLEKIGELPPTEPEPKKEEEEEEDYAKRQKEYFKKMGFMTKEDIDEAKKETAKEIKFDNRVAELEKRYDGEDGRPKFDKKAVAEYAEKHELYADPEIVYEQMHKKELIDWHIKKANEKGKGPQVPEPGKGGAKPPKGKSIKDMTEDEQRQHMLDKVSSKME